MTKNNQADFGENEPNETDKKFNLLYAVVIGISIALFIGFISVIVVITQMHIDAEANKQATYQSLRDQVKDQNDKIDALTDEVKSLTQAVQSEQKAAQATASAQ